MSDEYEGEPGDGYVENVHELRDFRHSLAQKGGEVVYTVCMGYYAYKPFSPDYWESITQQQQLAQTTLTRQQQLPILNDNRIKAD